jgi:outer membrane receptor protein involved in Fe transport
MQPRWKHKARATWDAPSKISLSLQWRHIGKVELAALDPGFNLTDEVSPANTVLRAQDYFDVATVFRVRPDFDLRLGVNNVLDRQPPLVVSNTAAGGGPYNANTYPTWYDPLGRYIFVSVAVGLKP